MKQNCYSLLQWELLNFAIWNVRLNQIYLFDISMVLKALYIAEYGSDSETMDWTIIDFSRYQLAAMEQQPIPHVENITHFIINK